MTTWTTWITCEVCGDRNDLLPIPLWWLGRHAHGTSSVSYRQRWHTRMPEEIA